MQRNAAPSEAKEMLESACSRAENRTDVQCTRYQTATSSIRRLPPKRHGVNLSSKSRDNKAKPWLRNRQVADVDFHSFTRYPRNNILINRIFLRLLDRVSLRILFDKHALALPAWLASATSPFFIYLHIVSHYLPTLMPASSAIAAPISGLRAEQRIGRRPGEGTSRP